METSVVHLFVSPGHNYVGHHGRAAGTHPMTEVEEVECVAGHGLRGDRFFDHREDYKGQITFFAMEVFEALRRELDLADASPSRTRRNVFTRGVHLPDLVGKEFAIQGIRFFGTEECRPCYWMNEAFRDPRVEQWLTGKGGLRARIQSTGRLRRDDGLPPEDRIVVAPPAR